MEVHSADRIKLDTPVTSIVRHRPLPGAAARYEEWLKEIIPVARRCAGHQGVNVIRPDTDSDAYTIVVHFDTLGHLRTWLESKARMRLIEEIRPFLQADESVDIETGLEFWFTPPPGRRSAKPYKQFLITLSAIFPLTVVIPSVLQPLFSAIPVLSLPGVGHLIVAAIIVGLMTYVVMPPYARLVSRWLYS
jgi:antibiotic biosynthesis monooxygenase (ABM) superfamily enzyme